MSLYQFAPTPTCGVSEHDFVTWENGFSTEEIKKIIEYGDNLTTSTASVFGDSDLKKVRRSQVAWIDNNPDTGWFYDRMAWIARQLNGQFFKFDLFGFVEDFQYTVYDEKELGHYDWHVDRGTLKDGMSPRKLSLVLQLSHEYEYDGGELQIMSGPNPQSVKKERGLVAAFPSYMLHRVTPVTAGVRKTLVVWTSGPAFK